MLDFDQQKHYLCGKLTLRLCVRDQIGSDKNKSD
jgi:hypothetical protein